MFSHESCLFDMVSSYHLNTISALGLICQQSIKIIQMPCKSLNQNNEYLQFDYLIH